jgi:hypothetical protein
MEFPKDAFIKPPGGYETFLEAIIYNSPEEANSSKSNDHRKEAGAHGLTECSGQDISHHHSTDDKNRPSPALYGDCCGTGGPS